MRYTHVLASDRGPLSERKNPNRRFRAIEARSAGANKGFFPMPTAQLRFRENDLRRAIRGVRKANLIVTAARIDPDGTIIIHTADNATTANQTNPWDEVLTNAAHEERAP